MPIFLSIIEISSAISSVYHGLFSPHKGKIGLTLVVRIFTLRLRGMGSSNSRLLPSCSSRLGSSGPTEPDPTPPRLGTRKGLKLSAESGGEGVEGLDWSLGADQLQ